MRDWDLILGIKYLFSHSGVHKHISQYVTDCVPCLVFSTPSCFPITEWQKNTFLVT